MFVLIFALMFALPFVICFLIDWVLDDDDLKICGRAVPGAAPSATNGAQRQNITDPGESPCSRWPGRKRQ